MSDVIDDRDALAEDRHHELRGGRTVAAVVRPEKCVVVVELHAAETGHRSHTGIGCAVGESTATRRYRFTAGISGLFTHSLISSTVSLNNC